MKNYLLTAQFITGDIRIKREHRKGRETETSMLICQGIFELPNEMRRFCRCLTRPQHSMLSPTFSAILHRFVSRSVCRFWTVLWHSVNRSWRQIKRIGSAWKCRLVSGDSRKCWLLVDTANSFPTFNLIRLTCLDYKPPILEFMTSFVSCDDRLKITIGLVPSNRVSNATRRIKNLMWPTTCS